MENIFIRDESGTFKNIVADKNEASNTTILAKKGYINNKKLILIDGIIQSENKDGELNDVNFKKTELSISLLKPRTITAPKMQETSTITLFKCIIQK